MTIFSNLEFIGQSSLQCGKEGSPTDSTLDVDVDEPWPVIRLIAIHDAEVLVFHICLVPSCRRDPC